MNGDIQYRLRLTVGAHSARHIRSIARSLLGEWKMPELADAVELGVTELVANVVRHVPDRRCEVLVLRQSAGVRVEVKDDDEHLPVLPAQMPLDAGGGVGKTVWFECRNH